MLAGRGAIGHDPTAPREDTTEAIGQLPEPEPEDTLSEREIMELTGSKPAQVPTFEWTHEAVSNLFIIYAPQTTIDMNDIFCSFC